MVCLTYIVCFTPNYPKQVTSRVVVILVQKLRYLSNKMQMKHCRRKRKGRLLNARRHQKNTAEARKN